MTARTRADEPTAAPDGTAVRVALWRAMHVRVDPPPHVLEDEIGLQLTAPDDGWRRRPDMDPHATSGFRAAIVVRGPRSGFKDARHIPGTWLAERYFADRADGLRPSSGEDLLVATT